MNITAMIPVVLFSQALTLGDIIQLPPASLKGSMSLEESIAKRRSIRAFASKPLSLEQIGQLLWAAQGITEKKRRLAFRPLRRRAVSPGNLCGLARWNLSL